MSNRQAVSYVKVAINNLEKDNQKITYENILNEMAWLFRMFTNENIEKVAESMY